MTEQDPEPRRYGRRLFLATVVGGVSSLYWGKAAWDHVTGVVSPVAEAIAPIIPSSGWRIYTISNNMPTFDRATWRLKIGGLVDQPVSLTYDEPTGGLVMMDDLGRDAGGGTLMFATPTVTLTAKGVSSLYMKIDPPRSTGDCPMP